MINACPFCEKMCANAEGAIQHIWAKHVHRKVEAFADASCRDEGGLGVIIFVNDVEYAKISLRVPRDATHKLEMAAVDVALQIAPLFRNGTYNIYTDCESVVKKLRHGNVHHVSRKNVKHRLAHGLARAAAN